MDKLSRQMSVKMGLKLFRITEEISEDQVRDGTIISFFWFLFNIFKIDIEIRLAEEPELTKVLYLTPSHLDHFFSKSKTLVPWVSKIFFFLKNL